MMPNYDLSKVEDEVRIVLDKLECAYFAAIRDAAERGDIHDIEQYYKELRQVQRGRDYIFHSSECPDCCD